jgi:D-glycero-alpha-D-manno-heptose 1-phosphate guanylyltransferase
VIKIEAIVLAGGLGTRLRDVVPDTPKPMAPINGIPFLSYILDYLEKNKIDRVILSTGYKSEKIEKYYGSKYDNINIIYSVENEPLGTGGAVKKALELSKEKDIFIINGDTFFNIDLLKMKNFHIKMNSYLSLAVKEMSDFNRYGSLIIQNNYVKDFEEKKYKKKGFINGGIYIVNKSLFKNEKLKKFSFEKKYLENKDFDKLAYISDCYFIDIGIPEDYEKAQIDFKGNLI